MIAVTMGKLYLTFRAKRYVSLAGIFLIASSALLAPIQLGMIAGELGAKVAEVKADNTTYIFCRDRTSPINAGNWIPSNSSNDCSGQGTRSDQYQYSGYYVTCSDGSPSNHAATNVSGCTQATDSGVSNLPNGTADVEQNAANQNSAAAAAQRNPTSCNSFATCIADLVYLVTVGPTSIFAYIGALFLSVGVKLSLSSTAYALGFLTNGWSVMRDVANMAFLFIVIFLAFTIILRADSSGTVSTLTLIIVMALLVNFSFFLTRVVVDAGNIAAVQVYNILPTAKDANGQDLYIQTSTCGGATNFICADGTKDLSANIMAGLNLQNLYSNVNFQNWANNPQNGFLTQLITLSALYIATAIILAVVGFMFLAAGTKFLVRIVALWFIIMASPLAFAAFSLPQTRSWFTRWRHLLITNTFYPAVFLFLFMLVIIFMNQACPQPATGVSGGTTDITTGKVAGQCLGLLANIFGAGAATQGNAPALQYATGLGANLTAVAIVMGLVVIMLFMVMKVSDRVSVSGSNLTAKLPGWVAGRYSGAIGWAGRQTAGRLGQRLSQSEWLQNKAATNTAARGALRASTLAATRSFDFRGAPVGGRILQQQGTGGPGGQGGRRAAVEATARKREEFTEQLKTAEAVKARRDREYEAEQFSKTGSTSRQKETELKAKENAARAEYTRINEQIRLLGEANRKQAAGETLNAQEQAILAQNLDREKLIANRRAANDSVSGYVTAGQEIQKARDAAVSNRPAEIARMGEYANALEDRRAGSSEFIPSEGSKIAASRIRDKLPVMAQRTTVDQITPGQRSSTQLSPDNTQRFVAPPNSLDDLFDDRHLQGMTNQQAVERLEKILNALSGHIKDSTKQQKDFIERVIRIAGPSNAQSEIVRNARNAVHVSDIYDANEELARAKTEKALGATSSNSQIHQTPVTPQPTPQPAPAPTAQPVPRSAPTGSSLAPTPGAPQHIAGPGETGRAASTINPELNARPQDSSIALPPQNVRTNTLETDSKVRRSLGPKRTNISGMHPNQPPRSANNNPPSQNGSNHPNSEESK